MGDWEFKTSFVTSKGVGDIRGTMIPGATGASGTKERVTSDKSDEVSVNWETKQIFEKKFSLSFLIIYYNRYCSLPWSCALICLLLWCWSKSLDICGKNVFTLVQVASQNVCLLCNSSLLFAFPFNITNNIFFKVSGIASLWS